MIQVCFWHKCCLLLRSNTQTSLFSNYILSGGGGIFLSCHCGLFMTVGEVGAQTESLNRNILPQAALWPANLRAPAASTTPNEIIWEREDRRAHGVLHSRREFVVKSRRDCGRKVELNHVTAVAVRIQLTSQSQQINYNMDSFTASNHIKHETYFYIHPTLHVPFITTKTSLLPKLGALPVTLH
jgi:hypothetical protein